jgi:hypothetical protein
MSKRDEILKEILSDKELMEKYNINKEQLKDLEPFKPDSKTIVNVLSTIISENDNKRNTSQIYKVIKNLHKI